MEKHQQCWVNNNLMNFLDAKKKRNLWKKFALRLEDIANRGENRNFADCHEFGGARGVRKKRPTWANGFCFAQLSSTTKQILGHFLIILPFIPKTTASGERPSSSREARRKIVVFPSRFFEKCVRSFYHDEHLTKAYRSRFSIVDVVVAAVVGK